MGVPHIQSFALQHEDWTTDGDNFDFINPVGMVSTTINSMPWAGTIGRILIGHGDTLADGSVQITQFEDGANTSTINNPGINFTGQVGIGVIIVDAQQAFNKDDGIRINLGSLGLQNQATTITVEVEFDFV